MNDLRNVWSFFEGSTFLEKTILVTYEQHFNKKKENQIS